MHTTREKMTMIGRLQKRPEFLRAAKEGKYWVSTGFILQAVPNNSKQSRFGLTITKKVYKQAVKRNRIRRRMRSLAYDILPSAAKDGYDYVLIGKAATLERPYKDLTNDLTWCLKKMNLRKDDPPQQ